MSASEIPALGFHLHSWIVSSDFDSQAGDGRMKMGFGLSTDFKIIQDHHGEIQIGSEVGIGTEVTVSLPVTERGSKPESEGCHEVGIDDIVTSRDGATAYRVERASYQLGFEVFGAAIGLAGVIYRLRAPRF